MDTHRNRLSEHHLKLLIKEFVRIRLKVRKYRIVSAEDYGNHWRVKIVHSNDDADLPPIGHMFAIDHHGSLIWERAC